jgi:hypothetical protein
VKGKTTQWLEDVIRAQTEFEILGYNVYEVLPLQNGSSITAGKALYIVDIPDSDRAPHQSRRDFKYYIRVASKSLPAPHRILEDIRNRQKHPDVNLSGISLEVVQLPTFSHTRPSLTLRDSTPTFEGTITLRFHVTLKNTSQVIANNTCFQLRSSEPGRITRCDERTVSSRGDGFWELDAPIYPNMEIKFWFDCEWNASYGLCEVIGLGEGLGSFTDMKRTRSSFPGRYMPTTRL